MTQRTPPPRGGRSAPASIPSPAAAGPSPSSHPPPAAVAEDRTFYPVEDDVGESSLQRFVSELLRALVERWLRARGKPTFVGANQFFYWEQYNPNESIAPDVYVVPGAPPSAEPTAWKVWETHLVPSFVFEIVSRDLDKDYLASPAKYGRLGVEELVVFDPEAQRSRTRFRWQVFRRAKRGLVRVEATNADRVRSEVLGCWLRLVSDGGARRVRLATGPKGAALLPTAEEAEAAAREAESAARAELERARAALEEERAALEEERATRARLEAELRSARTTSSKRTRRRSTVAR